MIVRRVNPQVGAGDTEVGSRILYPDVETKMRRGRRNAANFSANFLESAIGSENQTIKCITRPDITDDRPGAKFPSVRHPNTDGTFAALQYLSDLSINHNLAAAPFDHRGDRFRNPARATDRVAGTFKVMIGDNRMQSEAALPGWKPIIAPLCGEHPDQFIVASEPSEHFGGRTIRPTEKRRTHQAPQQVRDRTRDRFFREEWLSRPMYGLYRSDVTIDGSRFLRKIFFHASAEAFDTAHEFVVAVTDDKALVNIGHRCPFELAIGNLVERTAPH